MIKFINNSKKKPFIVFKENYEKALEAEQKLVEGISIASYDLKNKIVDSRYVNLKYVDDQKLIFFTNYSSPKALQFKSHNQVAANILWNTINFQIRLKGYIKKTSIEFNLNYFKSRAIEKNALAISSYQSKKISSYDEVVKRYKKAFDEQELTKCPEYWGGYEIRPYYFEFWSGDAKRLNKRISYELIDNNWRESFLQP